jgi:outer membrane protein assembly factor BamD
MGAFNEVLNRFPTSIYAKDARFKIDLIKDHLAAKEMYIGRDYLEKGSYVAAINRFKAVVENFQTTAQVEEALYRLVECYIAVGVRDQAMASAAVLGHNYPQSKWYSNAYTLLNQNHSVNLGSLGELPKPKD